MCAIVAPMRAAQVLPRPPIAAMHRTSLALLGLSPRCLSALALALLTACATPPADSAAPPQPQPAQPAPALPTRTANTDARGAGMQPDYAGEAAALREHMLARLPTPTPTDRRAACIRMLDAAASFYGAIEAAPDPRSKLLADLEATRADDQTRCERETSVRAASCVELRLQDRDAELPWLLDQCARAFPD